MNRALLIGLLWLAASPAIAATSQFDRPGYGNLDFGLSLAQVKRHYPQARLIEPNHFDLQKPLGWVGAKWRTVAVFEGGRLAAVLVVTLFEDRLYKRVIETSSRDLGPPGRERGAYFWRQSRRLVILGRADVGGRPMIFLRFSPLPGAKPAPTARPRPHPGPAVPGIFRATGSYRVCDKRNPYVSCITMFVWGAGKTEEDAKAACRRNRAAMIARYAVSLTHTANPWGICRVVK